MRKAIETIKQKLGLTTEDPTKQDVPTSNGHVIESLAHQREREEREKQQKVIDEQEPEEKIINLIPGVRLRIPPKKKK